MNLINRPRRLRNGALLRSMVRETRISADTLIYPMFVQDGENIREEIPSMPGQYRWSLDRVDELLQQVTDSGVKSVLLFGIPAEKDEIGSSAWQPDGIVQRAVHHIKAAYPQLYVITDVCMCEYTSHGHCGILCGHDVDNDKTLEVLAKTALSHVQAGADMVAPSDMMDGRVARIRQVLDENGYVNTPIMSYSVKYASAFYGPFRDAIDAQAYTCFRRIPGVSFAIMSRSRPPPTPVITPRKIFRNSIWFISLFITEFTPTTVKTPNPMASIRLKRVSYNADSRNFGEA